MLNYLFETHRYISTFYILLLNRYKFADKELNYILQKEDELLQISGDAIEDIVPFIRPFYKSKAFKAMEGYTVEVIDTFFGNKYKNARKTFDRSKISVANFSFS